MTCRIFIFFVVHRNCLPDVQGGMIIFELRWPSGEIRGYIEIGNGVEMGLTKLKSVNLYYVLTVQYTLASQSQH